MAIYHLHIKSISRSDGRSATGAAAYRSGERIRDERTGKLHNHSRRQDVAHKEIVISKHINGKEPEWAKDRAGLWNTVEQVETRRNARVAREYEISLPAELNGSQRAQLAVGFAQELADRHRTIIDVAIHEPRPGGDARNHHAHLLETTREITEEGFGAKAGLDMNFKARQELELPPGLVEFNMIRERWAGSVNEALRAAGFRERVDHRSYEAQGIDREPSPQLPYAAVQAERRGFRSEIAEQLRERYRDRVQRRLDQSQQREPSGNNPLDATAHPQPRSQTLEQIRQRARQEWLRLRRSMEEPASQEHSRDEKDLSM